MVTAYNTAGWTKEEYKDRLEAMTDEALLKECEQHIWLSAWANNNPRSAYHWMVDMCYDEASHRGKVKEIYTAAYRKVVKQETGKDPYPDEK